MSKIPFYFLHQFPVQMCVNGHRGLHFQRLTVFRAMFFKLQVKIYFKGYESEENKRVLVVRVNSEGK